MANVDTGPYAGLDAKLYYNSATHATPTWVEVTRAIDVSANISQEAVQLPSRASRWNKALPGLKDAEISFGYRVAKGADTVLDALLTMIASQAIKEFAVMDAAIALVGAQGLRAFCMLTAQNLNQGLSDGGVIEFSMKPAYKEESSAVVDPDWYEVT